MGRLRLWSHSTQLTQIASPGWRSNRTMFGAGKDRPQQWQGTHSLPAGAAFSVRAVLRSVAGMRGGLCGSCVAGGDPPADCRLARRECQDALSVFRV